MTEIILNFPARNVAPLSCVWIETGNPAQPLVCRWAPREKSSSVRSFEITSEPHAGRLCA